MTLDEFVKHLKKGGEKEIQNSRPDPTKTSVIGVERDGGVQFDHIHLGKAPYTYTEHKTNVLKDSVGRSYFEITKFGADQMFLARILKGIMPVSDVVYNNGKFMSYEMPLGLIPKDAEEIHWKKKVQVYNFLLEFIFSDGDYHSPIGGNAAGTEDAIGLYDFDVFGSLFWKQPDIKKYTDGISNKHSNLNDHQFRTLCRELLSRLREVLGDEGGLAYLRAVLSNIRESSSETPVTIRNSPGNGIEEKTRSFRNEVLRRIEQLETFINKYNVD